VERTSEGGGTFFVGGAHRPRSEVLNKVGSWGEIWYGKKSTNSESADKMLNRFSSKFSKKKNPNRARKMLEKGGKGGLSGGLGKKNKGGAGKPPIQADGRRVHNSHRVRKKSPPNLKEVAQRRGGEKKTDIV